MRLRNAWARSEIDQDGLVARALIGLVGLGIVLRLVRYLQNFPLWCDETMLAANLLDRRWSELVEPLDYRQVCPVGFLGLEWLVTRWFGFSEFSLRLIPLLCALASVPLFVFLASRTLGGKSRATLLATALFAVSAPPIRYSAEVKPYATDLLCSLLLLSLAAAWRRAPAQSGWPLALAVSAPLIIALSFPSLFVIGSIAIFGLWLITTGKRLSSALAYTAFLTAAGTAVALLAALDQYHASSGDTPYLLGFWASAFPPSWREPAALGHWLLRAHTGPLFAYPQGAGRLAWLTPLVLGAFVVGVFVWWRRDRRATALLLLPFALTLVAAALRRYPYGMSARVAQHLLPSTLVLVAAGVTWLVERVKAPRLAPRIILGLVTVLAAMGLWQLGHDVAHPYRTPWDQATRAFAKQFWNHMAEGAVLVCAETDLGISCHDGRWAYDGTDQYLCLQRIYSPRHREGRPPHWDAISPTRPLRCVLINRMPTEVPAFRQWIESHRDRYTLRHVRMFPGPKGSDVEPVVNYVVCEFVPTPTARAVSLGGKPTTTPRTSVRN